MRKTLVAALLCWTVVAEPGRVLDGDTFDAKLWIWPAIYTLDKVRVLGVDTPEITGGTPETRAAAQAAKAFTAAWLAKGEILVEVCKRDSFGRLLGRVTRQGEDLADALIKTGMGVPR
jgi:endonuclease YncB( thermonuclease family)